MSRSRAALLEIMPDLYEAAVLLFWSEDVLRFREPGAPARLPQGVAGRVNGRLDQRSDCEEKFRERSKFSPQIL